MQKQDSNLKVRGTLNSYKPSQCVFQVNLMLAIIQPFHIRNFGCKDYYIFLEIVFRVASTL